MAKDDKFHDLGYQKGRANSGYKKKKGSAQEPASSNLIRITGLWETRVGNGLSGLVSPTCRLVILENKNREKESDPPFIAFWAHSSKDHK